MKLYKVTCSWIQSVTRINNAQAAILERPDPKPTTEVLQTLPDELSNLLEQARHSQSIRNRLPSEWQAILEEEELEA